MKSLSLLLVLSVIPVLALAQNDSPPPPDGVSLTPITYNWGQGARDYPYFEVFTLENNTDHTITITGIDADPNPPFSIVHQLTTCGNTLAAGQKCYIEVKLYASYDGKKSGTLTVDCTGAPACPLTSSLGATIVSDVTLHVVDGGSCSLAAYVGDEASCTVTLTSYLPDQLQITDIDALPDPPFSETNNCPRNLKPYGSCTITVTCMPTQEGLVEGSLTVTDNAPDGGPPPLGLSCYGLPIHVHCPPSGCQE